MIGSISKQRKPPHESCYECGAPCQHIAYECARPFILVLGSASAPTAYGPHSVVSLCGPCCSDQTHAPSIGLYCQCVHMLLPMSSDTLKALTYDLLAFGSSVPVIRVTGVWSAIQDRHSHRWLVASIFGAGEIARWNQCIAHIIGIPFLLNFPIPQSDRPHSAPLAPNPVLSSSCMLLVCLITLACMRVSEACRLQFCDSATSASTSSPSW